MEIIILDPIYGKIFYNADEAPEAVFRHMRKFYPDNFDLNIKEGTIINRHGEVVYNALENRYRVQFDSHKIQAATPVGAVLQGYEITLSRDGKGIKIRQNPKNTFYAYQESNRLLNRELNFKDLRNYVEGLQSFGWKLSKIEKLPDDQLREEQKKQ